VPLLLLLFFFILEEEGADNKLPTMTRAVGALVA
jgi:hypothetical protein